MLTVGQVAKRYQLSRSTLLYYDNKGILKPSGRNHANYRVYSIEDINKLERIILLRNAGMPLADISLIIDKSLDEIEAALESRLFSINKEIQTLRNQQQVIINLISKRDNLDKTRIVTKERWVEMLTAAGLDESGMWLWHREFEASSPEAHQDFLESIGINQAEIEMIRKRSRSAHKP
ncbi:MAG: MerR family transcriptional regulator [Candidatus Thiodiazotropha taylori]|nr:MerR family transcriptional regulator [Candidatus Thiodiazotropha taylori]RLW51678.1 MAG: MerR family transcriptional regulator [gamma proteobacterium symbiont of Stewartia floridana]MCG7926427.1 MerR family transcriptional regulator [Candidatus Thiodiazotropha taylori]MCG7935876.1 MerR family transcriptional regulator [Candidatus Thiodiazotropha taylori]MCG7969330.1 MerR family transcriptional regulator [Candidatus Thiodiazotropha taylori]